MSSLIPVTPSLSRVYWQPFHDFKHALEVKGSALALAELDGAAQDYPVFVRRSAEGSWQLYALFGNDQRANAYVNRAGKWLARSIPLESKLAPFILQKDTLYYDSGRNSVSENEGEPFVGDDGQLAPRVNAIKTALQQLKQGQDIASMLCQQLFDYGLLRPWAGFTATSEVVASQMGLMDVDEKALVALPVDAKFVLLQSGALRMAYLLAFSQFNNRVITEFASLHSRQVVTHVLTPPRQAENTSSNTPSSDIDDSSIDLSGFL